MTSATDNPFVTADGERRAAAVKEWFDVTSRMMEVALDVATEQCATLLEIERQADERRRPGVDSDFFEDYAGTALAEAFKAARQLGRQAEDLKRVLDGKVS